MSVSSEKGKELEKRIATLLKKKLGARVVRDGRSGAGSHQKMDILDYYRETPFDIEAKNHKTIAIKEWMRQAKAGAGLGRIPTVVFQADDDVLACVPFDHLVNLAVEIKQLEGVIADLHRPVVLDAAQAVEKAVSLKSGDVRTCRNGHIVSPGSNKCLDKKCPYSSTYKPKKSKS